MPLNILVTCSVISVIVVCTVSKNVTILSRYNSDIHESISVIFGVNITEKVDNQNVLYFPCHLTSVLHYPAKCRNTKISSFQLRCCCIARLNQSLA